VEYPVREGEVLAGKYRVGRVVAAGGMGVVIAAEHLKLHQPVALKFMRSDLAESPDAVKRFLLEARAAARLRNEHVARILDVCELDSGEPYIVMELLEGCDLGSKLPAVPPMAMDVAVGYVIQACAAIAEAHSLGIIHRDLKPENLFLAQQHDGSVRVKVLDFGISKVTSDARRTLGSRITTKDALGSPAYMSPEQMRSAGEVDPRADVWSLGVILYELLAGRQPFEAPSIAEICLKVTDAEPPPLGAIRQDLPAELVQAVHRCLAKNPDERWPSVVELSRAIAPFVRASQGAGDPRPRVLSPSDAPIHVVSPPTVKTSETLELPLHPSPWRRVVIATTAAVLAAASGFGLDAARRSLAPVALTPAMAPFDAPALTAMPLDPPAAPSASSAPRAAAAPAGSVDSGESSAPGPASKGGERPRREPFPARGEGPLRPRKPSPEAPKAAPSAAASEDVFSLRK
jgi:serine/threonine protein kinase